MRNKKRERNLFLSNENVEINISDMNRYYKINEKEKKNMKFK